MKNKIKKIFLFFIFNFFIIGCDRVNNFIDNSFFDGKYNINAKDFFSINKKEYYIYYYSSVCPQCDSLKGRISKFIENKNNIFVYTLSLENISDEEFNVFKKVDKSKSNEEMREEMINSNCINEIYLIGTPILYKINTNLNEKKCLENAIIGNRKINEYLDNYL